MDPLIIDAIKETPSVILRGSEGIFSFKGKSYPENVHEFYDPIISYLEEYIQNPQEKTILEFNWLYFNTATFKMIVKIILLLKKVTEKDKTFTVNWYCSQDDELMPAKGEELKELLNVEFNILFV